MEDKELLEDAEYLRKGVGTNEAVKGLKQLYQYLSDVPQAESPKSVKHLSKVTTMLVKPHIFNASFPSIQLYLSCCLAEIIRINAPNAPYKESQLKKIFALFLTILEDIHKSKNAVLSNLLQQLVQVKAFLLLVDLDMQLVRDTFTQFLNLPTEEISPQNTTNLLNILALCIQVMSEDDDILDDDILQTILIPLLPLSIRRGKEAKGPEQIHPAHFMAQKLILHCSSELQPSIVQLIQDAIHERGKGEGVYSQYHRLIIQINAIAPSMLIHALPRLERELKSNIVTIRERAVGTLNKIVKQNPSLFSNNRQLYDTFLHAHDDANASIRLQVVNGCKVIFEYHPDTFQQINNILCDRAIDVSENVRAEAIVVICDAAERNLEKIPASLIELVANRMIDSKHNVRTQSFLSLSSLYREISESDVSGREYDTKIRWIPKKMICCFHYKEWHIRHHVEHAINELLPLETEEVEEGEEDDLESERAACLLDIALTFVDEPQIVKAYKLLLSEKSSFQHLFREFLDSKMNADMFEDVDEMIFKKMAGHFSDFPSIEENMANLNSLSPTMMKELRVILDQSEIVEERAKAKERALRMAKPFGEKLKPSERSFIAFLLDKLDGTHITPSTVPKMFSHISSRLPKEADEKLPEEIIKLLGFMESISEAIPECFVACYLQLKAMLSDENENIVHSALSILSHTAQSLKKQTFSKDILMELKRLCEEGTPKQAKCAIQSLSKLYQPTDADYSYTFNGLLEKLTVYLLGGSPPNLDTVLCSIGCIAKMAPDTFESQAKEFQLFVIQTLFHPKSSFSWQSRMYGVKALVNYAITLEGEEHKDQAKQILSFLFSILDNHASIEEDEVDSSVLRKTVVIGILQLAKKQMFDHLISHSNFLLLVQTTQDPCFEVRMKLVEFLYASIRVLSLRLRYLAFLFMFVADPETYIRKKAKEYFSLCVTTLRQLVIQRINREPRIKQFNPENCLPFLLFLLSHRQRFEEDVPDYPISSHYLKIFIDLVKTKDSFPFLYQFFSQMRSTADTVDPSCSERMYLLCELGKKIIVDQKPKNWPQQNFPFFLPSIYQMMDAERLREYRSKKYLPASFVVHKSATKHYHPLGYLNHDVDPYIIDPIHAKPPKAIGAIISPKKPKQKKRKRKTLPGRKSPPAKRRKKGEESPPPLPPRQRSRRKTASQVSYEEKSEEEEEEDSSNELSISLSESDEE